ncbi:MAG: hypothetical protein JWN70_517 [Planctomycetaceae bacterium]|nr:hypothetical protein [Planctomycetaceae bacterium]
MSPLQERLAELRAKVRQLLWLYGLSWLVAVLLGALLVVGCVDWLLHLDDAGVRLILGLGILGGVGYVGFKRLITPLKVPMTDIDLALRIERRFPKFRDSLVSTIQFLQDGKDPKLGAPALQQRVIDKTLKQTRLMDFEDVVQTQPVQRIAWTALMVCITTALVVGFNQAEAATALKRLVFPFGAHPWPRKTQLQFVKLGANGIEALAADPHDPLRIARGDTLELTVINLNNRGRLPSNVQLEFKDPEGAITREVLQRTTLADEDHSREAAFANIVIKTPFQFRAVGGDDQTMDWFPLEVVPPPVAESLQVNLIPPKYTRKPVVKLPAGVGHVEGLVGTKVQIAAKSNKPLSSALLKIRDKDQQPMTIAKDGMKLSTVFQIREAGIYSYWLDLRDKQNFGNSDAPRYEIRAIQDTPPDIYIDRPAIDIQVTPTAEIPLRFVAKDDLGLHQVRMRFQILEPGKTDLTKPVEIPLISLEKRPLQHSQEHLWQLEPLKLVPGMQIQLHGEATDDYDLGPRHVGRSLTRTLTVITPEEKTQELADRQIGLLGDLERAKKQETEIQAQTAELRTQLEKTGQLRPQDVDMLQRIEGQQRQIATAMQNSQDGMLARAEEILKEFRQNRLDSPETEQRLGQIRSELQRLADEHLSEIEQNLTQARKLAGGNESRDPGLADPEKKKTGANPGEKTPDNAGPEVRPEIPDKVSPTKPLALDSGKPGDKTPNRISDQPRPGASPTEKALHQAQRHQQAVTETLGDLLQELSQWQDERQMALDLQDIKQAQDKIKQDTTELGKQTVTKSLQELKPQEQADLARQAERQKHEADQLDQLQRRLGDVVKKLQEDDPAAAGRMQDILDQLQQNNTSGKMRTATQQVGENKIGEAGETQQRIADELQALEDALKNRPVSDLETLVKQMKQAEQDLADLAQQQEELLKKTAEAQAETDPQVKEEQLEKLKKEQQELEKKAEQLARKLQRLQVKSPAEAARRAAERMQQAGESLEKDENTDQAEKQEQEALDDIEQAQRELAKEREQAEERLAFEQLEKVADEIKTLAERQQGVLVETKRLNDAQAARGNWTFALLKTLRELAETQRGIREETNGLAEKLSAAEVFALAVKRAARQMEQAAKRLDEKQTGPETQQFEQAAFQRFQELVEALQQEKKEKPADPPEQQPGGNGGAEQAPQPVDTVAMLAQLKMLRSLQVELNTRLQSLGEKRDSGNPLTAAELEELKGLGEEQGELAELGSKFLKMFEKPEQEPAAGQPAGKKVEEEPAAKSEEKKAE